MRHAFKEWAVICRALEEAQQSLILRKGGILEVNDGFRVEHDRFWLFPTYTHQQEAGIRPEHQPLLRSTVEAQPPAGLIRLRSFAVVDAVFQLQRIEQVLALAPLHIWSEETVRARFDYRRPGLFALAVRIFVLPTPSEIQNTSYYEGCKSWVELEVDLATDAAKPVLPDAVAVERLAEVRRISGGFEPDAPARDVR